MSRFSRGVALIITFVVLVMTGAGAFGGYTSGIYTHGDDTAHRGWDGAWRVALMFGGVSVALIIVSAVIASILIWMRGDR